MPTMLALNLISADPKIRGGRPCIAGTELRVLDIVAASQIRHRTPEEIAEVYDLSLGQVHAALAFYYENKEMIDEDLRQQIAVAEAYEKVFEENGGRSILP